MSGNSNKRNRNISSIQCVCKCNGNNHHNRIEQHLCVHLSAMTGDKRRNQSAKIELRRLKSVVFHFNEMRVHKLPFPLVAELNWSIYQNVDTRDKHDFSVPRVFWQKLSDACVTCVCIPSFSSQGTGLNAQNSPLETDFYLYFSHFQEIKTLHSNNVLWQKRIVHYLNQNWITRGIIRMIWNSRQITENGPCVFSPFQIRQNQLIPERIKDKGKHFDAHLINAN